MVGASNRSEALEHIYYFGLPQPANNSFHTLEEYQAIRPFAKISNVRYGFTPNGTFSSKDAGELVIEIEENIAEENLNVTDVPEWDFWKRLGNILRLEYHNSESRGLEDLMMSQGNDYFVGGNAEIVAVGRGDRNTVDSYGDYMYGAIAVRFGGGRR